MQVRDRNTCPQLRMEVLALHLVGGDPTLGGKYLFKCLFLFPNSYEVSNDGLVWAFLHFGTVTSSILLPSSPKADRSRHS